MLDKKQIGAVFLMWGFFLFEFKMGHKAADTTHNIGIAFGQELLTDI